MSASALADVVDSVSERLPRLVAQVCTATYDRIPAYRSGGLVSEPELHRSVMQNLGFLVEALRAPEAAELDLRVPRETGRRRARQGFPLPEVLQCYRLSVGTLWEALLDRARASRLPTAETELLAVAGRLWQLSDEHAVALTDAYRLEAAELLVVQQRRRSALVEALLTGQREAEAGPWEAASLLGLPPDAAMVVVAAETRGLAEESLPGVERQLGALGVASGWRLTPALQLGIVAVADGQLEIVLKVLGEAALARTGVSPLYRSLAETPRALQLARTALATLPPGERRVQVFSSSPLAALLAREPEEGQRLATQVLGPVLALPEDDRKVLLETLHTYLDHGCSAERAALPLHCHPNTVRYRLRRVHELTGRTTSDAYGLAELTAASYAVRVTGLSRQTSDSVGTDTTRSRPASSLAADAGDH